MSVPAEIFKAYDIRGLSGWEPQVALDDGLRRTIDWYRANPSCLGGT